MANNKYIATIPGNYMTHWLNGFAKAVENNEYKRIEYKTWRDLKKYSTFNKINIIVEKDIQDKLISITFNYPYIKITEPNEFFLYLKDHLSSPGDIQWHEYKAESYLHVIDDILKDDTYYINNDNIYTYQSEDIEKLIENCNNITSIPLTTTATVMTVPAVSVNDNWAAISTVDNISSTIEDLKKELKELKEQNKEKEKDKNNMNTNNMFAFDFGSLDGTKDIRMSMYGFAVLNDNGKYVAYDAKNNCMMDVQVLNFSCPGMFYKIPKSLNTITIGDIIFHNGDPVFVREISEDRTRFFVISPTDGTEKTILPAKSMFGFNYLTCLVSLMDNFNTPASADNPFGNMLPFILMSNGKESDQTLPLLLMTNGNMAMDNPLMLLALSGNANFNLNNPLMAMAMMKMFDKK